MISPLELRIVTDMLAFQTQVSGGEVVALLMPRQSVSAGVFLPTARFVADVRAMTGVYGMIFEEP